MGGRLGHFGLGSPPMLGRKNLRATIKLDLRLRIQLSRKLSRTKFEAVLLTRGFSLCFLCYTSLSNISLQCLSQNRLEPKFGVKVGMDIRCYVSSRFRIVCRISLYIFV